MTFRGQIRAPQERLVQNRRTQIAVMSAATVRHIGSKPLCFRSAAIGVPSAIFFIVLRSRGVNSALYNMLTGLKPRSGPSIWTGGGRSIIGWLTFRSSKIRTAKRRKGSASQPLIFHRKDLLRLCSIPISICYVAVSLTIMG